MYEWLHAGRLATVIDCWTIKDVRKIYLWFQLSDQIVKPKNTELPDYCMYAKTNYGWLVNNTLDPENKSILEALGYTEGDIIDFFITNIGKSLNINVRDNEYNGKVYPIVEYEWHTKHEWDIDIEWGTNLKSFKLTDETTRSDIEALWFENKFLKKSKEYIDLPRQDFDEDSIDDLF